MTTSPRGTRAERAGAVAVEAVVEVELDVGEVVGRAGEERRAAGPRACAGARTPARGRAPGRGSSDVDDAAVARATARRRRSRAPRTGRASASSTDVVASRAVQRRGLRRPYAPLLGYVYVPLGVLALALGADHQQAASALFTGAAFAFLWFLGSLHARIIRYDPDGFFASIVVLGGAALLALQAAALALAHARRRGPERRLRGDGDHRLVARRARARARCRAGSAGPASPAASRCSCSASCEAAADWTFVGSTLLGLVARLHDLGARDGDLPRAALSARP